MKFNQGDRVIYIPNHAYGDREHADCEAGEVSFANEKYVFVIFDTEPSQTVSQGVGARAVSPDNLVLEAQP